MEFKYLIYQKKESVATLTVNRPEVLNAFNYQTASELKTLLRQIQGNSNVRAVIITGAGEKSFVIGADREELQKPREKEEEARAFETCCREAFALLEHLGKPSIAAINGFAFGLGLQLCLACTFRIIANNAKLALPEINLGFFPSMGATQRLSRLIGEAKASEMILMGEPIDAEEAYRIGLANKNVSPAELKSVAEMWAGKLAEKSPITMNLAMEAIGHARRATGESGFAFEAMLSDLCLTTEDAKEALAAYIEKKRPRSKAK